MKKIVRVCLIGALHSVVYLWLIPFILFPGYGKRGSSVTIVLVVVVSIWIAYTAFAGKTGGEDGS